MKGYPVTKNELWGLGTTGLATSVAFSAATGLIGFYLDTSRELDLAAGLDPAKAARWETLMNVALWGAGAAALFGTVLLVGGALYIIQIIRRTVFKEA